ncbi:MAG: diguanylate cyclase [Oscillospiraceae bacterium]
MKIKVTILIAAICFAVIPLVARVALSQHFITDNSAEQYQERVKSMAQSQVASLQAIIDKADRDLDTLAAYPPMGAATSKGETVPILEDFVSKFSTGNDMITAARVVNDKGMIIAGEGKGTELAGYAEYSDSSKYYDDTLYFDTIDNSSKTMFIKRSMNNCMLMISYDAATQNSLLSKTLTNCAFDVPNNKSQGKIVVSDINGNWSSGSGFYPNLKGTYTETVTNAMSSLNEGVASDIVRYPVGSDNFIASLVRVGGEHGLVAIASCSDIKNGLNASGPLAIIIVTAVLLAVVAVVAAVIVSGSVTKPLKDIETTLERVLRGDHEARIGTISLNEYGQLSRSFNTLIDEIVVSEDRYKTISDMSDNIIFEWNFITNEVTFSNNFNKKFSYRPSSDHFGDSFLLKAKIHPDDADRYRSDLDALEKGKNFERNEYRIKNIYGDFIWVLMRTSTIKDDNGKTIKVVGVMVDIDRAKKSEQQLTERASFDALTELYNRETIESQIDNEISLSEMRKSEMAVLFIDVDDFKHFNDNYSHAVGDAVLKFVAKTIKEAVGDAGFAGRYGGDEFIAMVRNAEVNSPAPIAQKIIDRLQAGFDTDEGERLSVSVSIGIADIKDDYNTRVEYLIGKADDAMYSVKKSGKSNYAFI